MITKAYLDFDDLFHSFNKDILLNLNNYIKYIKGKSAYLDTTIIEVKNYNCCLDLGRLIYTKNKFYKLINSYLDLKEWELFKEKLKNTHGNSLTFYFKKDKKKQGTTSDNGPCMISMVFIKEKDKFNKVFIYYRTTELNRRFGADLIFFHHLLKDLETICEINSINFILPLSYISLFNILLTMKLENIKVEEISTEGFGKNIIRNINNIYEEEELSTYKSKKRIQLLVSDKLDLKSIDINSLTLRKEKEN